ncbi:hypothetical protein N3K63_00560 [Microbacterium sp. W1N]|uniref:rhamnan synthesis F family protein n=1 Tax=Microbacterium festucae TaxID=2977531 RepID=UPI0021C07110|nr:rhamnan synthesis F family protein [Microbacterium festucae]MCT9818767.1 hypothetical protein [Microbacterium festucae]
MVEPVEHPRRRLIYAIEGSRPTVDDQVIFALTQLRPLMDDVIVIAPRSVEAVDRARLRDVSDAVFAPVASAFRASDYGVALSAREAVVGGADEVILSGDSWFGPVNDFRPVLERMADSSWDAWQLVENSHRHQPESFPGEGFPAIEAPWVWTVLRDGALRSGALATFWETLDGDDVDAEHRLLPSLAESGLSTTYAFHAAEFRTGDPLVFGAVALMHAGCPVVARSQFRLFPPLLDQHAVVGRETVAAMAKLGYSSDLVWQSLARTVPPKALNVNAGLFNVIPDRPRPGTDDATSLRLLVILHVSDGAGLDVVFRAMENLPAGYDLLVTAPDGMTAATIQRRFEEREDLAFGSLEVRVVPPGPGRDMSDFFVGCRDVLLSGDHDIVVKLHHRPAPRKTLNLNRYSRRYQLENLLNSPGYVRNVLQMFAREPGLGLVFPPMVHIGFGTMGRAWAGLESAAARLRDTLGIRVPVDAVSPLAPYGGMWIGRPQALRIMTEHRWRHADYRRGKRERELAHVQERTVVSAAAEAGFHSRTILTSEHASISHTALQFKTDQVSMSVRGYPVDQIRFLHLAGATGFGGPVALMRMYLRLNHFGLARRLLPLYYFARRGHRVVGALRQLRPGRSPRRKESA